MRFCCSIRTIPRRNWCCRRLLRRRRELAAQNPAAYRPDLANTLSNLGDLYRGTHRFADAEAAVKEAAGIWRIRGEAVHATPIANTAGTTLIYVNVRSSLNVIVY